MLSFFFMIGNLKKLTLCHMNQAKLYIKIHKKWHNHEAQTSRGMQRRRDEEQIMTTQTPYIKTQTHEQRRTAAQRNSIGMVSWKTRCLCGGKGGGGVAASTSFTCGKHLP